MTADVTMKTADLFDQQCDFLWVQMDAKLKIVDVDGDTLTARRDDGSIMMMTKSEAESRYFQDGDDRMKPYFHPVQARRVVDMKTLGVANGLDAGDVTITDGANVFTISAGDYARNYTAVAYPDVVDKPIAPFTSASRLTRALPG